MSAIKKSVSMPLELWEKMQARRKSLGYANPSAYLQWLVMEDLATKKAHIRTATEDSNPVSRDIVGTHHCKSGLYRRLPNLKCADLALFSTF